MWESKVEYSGSVTMACLQCGTSISSDEAMQTEQIAKGVRFLGVHCPVCLKTFTIEMTASE
jgi:predicted nucleic acid-binding Zn ribbon protein